MLTFKEYVTKIDEGAFSNVVDKIKQAAKTTGEAAKTVAIKQAKKVLGPVMFAALEKLKATNDLNWLKFKSVVNNNKTVLATATATEANINEIFGIVMTAIAAAMVLFILWGGDPNEIDPNEPLPGLSK